MFGALLHVHKMDREDMLALRSLNIDLKSIQIPNGQNTTEQIDEILNRNPILRQILEATNNGLCHDTFDDWFVYEEVMRTDFTLYYKENAQINAIACIQVVDYDDIPMLEVLMFCSNMHSPKGSGSTLMRLIQNLVKEMGLEGILLDSVEDAIGFYERHGFKIVPSEEEEDVFHMTWMLGVDE